MEKQPRSKSKVLKAQRNKEVESNHPIRFNRCPRKILACSLTAALSLGLCSPIFAAGQEDLDHHVTGTIVELSLGSATLDTRHGGPFYIGLENNVGSHLKVGQRVTLHYYLQGMVKCMPRRSKGPARPIKLARSDEGEREPVAVLPIVKFPSRDYTDTGNQRYLSNN